ncbi:phospholipase [Rhizobium sp. TH2]|uniref:phospholipase D-like domain-containing protein n=1 Tax=Rhizobium sp. TH2 TaxID=2775403 RepID=UPI00215810E3|nr:phospholipase D-like domain-containing protein [Rhizobium sp. TH2]UVC06576.1 phospholipase [Rhizobium sp. TH2]
MQQAEGHSSIINLESNAWRSDPAEKVGFIIDAAEYYRSLQEILPKAKSTIWIIGWDFNPDIYLDPERPDVTLGAFLRSLVDENEELEIRILVWAMGPIYSGKSLRLFSENTWSNHPRIHLRFDAKHPLRGSHHQKIVVVDDTISFLGGIDLTARRWDTPAHDVDNPLRVSPDGEAYDPVHDLQSVVTGPSAVSIGDLARKRWERATGEKHERVTGDDDLWPSNIEPALAGCQVALSLTEPGRTKRRSKKQAMQLTIDALRSARRHIYMETQYFAFFGIADCMSERLRDPNGPDVVVVLTRASHGFLEKVIMGGNRDRLIRRLKRADIHGRLRVMYPVVPKADGTEQDVLIHSKLLIIDDRFVRLGSSNLNNRSEGMDTEADIAIESTAEGCSASITSLRNCLMAEHLDASEEAVAEAIARTHSLTRTIDELNTRPRGLRDMQVQVDKGGIEPIWGTDLVDPAKPFRLFQRVRKGLDAAATRLFGIFV